MKFINYADSESQKAFQQKVRRFLADEFAPIAKEIDEKEQIALECIKKMGQLGFLAPMAPTEYDGGGHDVICAAIVAEEIAKICAGTYTSVMGHIFCMHWLDKFGTSEQREKYIPKLATGEFIGCIGITEPEAGSDVANLKTKAAKDGNHYILNGVKTFITNGNIADVMIAMVRTGGPGPKGISNFIVDTITPGYEASLPFEKMGNRASPTCEVVFNDCRVPVENILGKENYGFINVMNFFPFERVFVAVACGALSESSFHVTRQYALEQKEFGHTIIQSQMIQHMISEMACYVQSIKSITKHCLQKYASGLNANTEASMAKLYSSDLSMKVTLTALQILGAHGYTRDYPVERWIRDVKLFAIGGGTSQIQRQIIARAMVTN